MSKLGRTETVRRVSDSLLPIRLHKCSLFQDMEDIKNELDRIKQENRKMEDELRSMLLLLIKWTLWTNWRVYFQVNSHADQKAHRLAAKLTENQGVIEHLRREREALTSDHAELHRRFSKVTEVRAGRSFPLNIKEYTKMFCSKPNLYVNNWLIHKLHMTIEDTNWIYG